MNFNSILFITSIIQSCILAADRDFDVDFSNIRANLVQLPTALAFNDDMPFERIVGGREAERNSIPYQAGIIIQTNRGNFFCGGTLLTSLYVLTAAHCLDNALAVQIRLGAHIIDQNEPTQVRINASRWMQHERWNPDVLIDDIAVIELSQEAITNDNIQFVNLPRRSNSWNTFVDRIGRISGWGLAADGSERISPVLRRVNVRVMRNFVCNIQYLGFIRETHVCTAGRGGRGSCSGDSGGPLVVDDVQVGIVSFGLILGCEFGWPSAFTRTTSYLDWIERNTDVTIRP